MLKIWLKLLMSHDGVRISDHFPYIAFRSRETFE